MSSCGGPWCCRAASSYVWLCAIGARWPSGYTQTFRSLLGAERGISDTHKSILVLPGFFFCVDVSVCVCGCGEWVFVCGLSSGAWVEASFAGFGGAYSLSLL